MRPASSSGAADSCSKGADATDLREELKQYLNDEETRKAVFQALFSGLKTGDALKLIDYALKQETDAPAPELPEESDMSAYSDNQLRALLAAIEAEPDG